jgi:hypothetical protein
MPDSTALYAAPESAQYDFSHSLVDYCIYHHAHGDYTYSEKWVELLVAEIADEGKWAAIKAYKI